MLHSKLFFKKKWKVRLGFFFLQKAIDFNFRGKQCILQLCMYFGKVGAWSKDAGILFLIRFLCCHYPKIWKMTFRQPCLQCNIMLRERERNFTYYANSYFLEENAFKSQFMTNAIYFPGFPSHFIKEFRSKCRHKSQRNPPPSKNFDFRQIA